MKTLSDLIVAAKCRKGAAAGTTKKGAYWLAVEPIKIRCFGGDGIGQSSADCTNYLELRHFRDGAVSIVIHYNSWHQNHGMSDTYQSHIGLPMCETVEDVIVALKSANDDGVSAYSDRMEENLTEALVAFGLPESAPAPDEDAAAE